MAQGLRGSARCSEPNQLEHRSDPVKSKAYLSNSMMAGQRVVVIADRNINIFFLPRRGNLWVNWVNSAGRLVEEPVELLASGIEGALLVLLGFHGVDQRATFFVA